MAYLGDECAVQECDLVHVIDAQRLQEGRLKTRKRGIIEGDTEGQSQPPPSILGPLPATSLPIAT